MKYCVRNRAVYLVVVSLSFLFSSGAMGKEPNVDSHLYQVSTSVENKGNQKIVRIEVRPAKNLHCNLEYPWKLVLKSSESLGVATDTFRKSEAATWSDNLVVFEIPLTSPKAAAKATFELKLSVCNDKQCFMKKVSVIVSLK